MAISAANVSYIRDIFQARLGVPYVYGGVWNPGDAAQGCDCSGLCGTVLEALVHGPDGMSWMHVVSTESWPYDYNTNTPASPGTVGPYGTIAIASPNDAPADAALIINIMHGGGGENSHMSCCLRLPVEVAGQPAIELEYMESNGTHGTCTAGDAYPNDASLWTDHWFLRGPIGGSAPAIDTAVVLSQAMGGEVSLNRYRELLPAVTASLQFCQCTTVDRIAMWCAQLGEESGGLQWMKELASGAEYEGRTDLGNTQPGDGVRFKGRGPIQITGRANYTSLSAWAYGRGLVPSPSFFIDQPTQLSSDQYGFIGVDWYWTVARNMNSYADNGDVLGATKAVNGGTNGLQDRTDRWNRCRAMGQQLLTLATTGDDMAQVPQDQWNEALDLLRQGAEYRRQSLSAFRHVGEGPVNTCMGFAWSADGSTHVQLVERLAVEYGDPTSVALLMEVAAADPVKYPDRAWDAKLAARVLAKVSDTAKAEATAQIKAWLAAEPK